MPVRLWFRHPRVRPACGASISHSRHPELLSRILFMSSNWDENSDTEAGNDHVSSVLSTLFGLQGAGRSGDRGAVSLQGITLSDLRSLLNRGTSSGFGGFRFVDDDEEDDEDYQDEDGFSAPINSEKNPWHTPVTEPNPTGVELLMGGEFGSVASKASSRQDHKNVARQILNRSGALRQIHSKEPFLQDLVPNTNGTAVAKFDDNVYTAQFSADSSFFYTCAQDFRLHVFDMSSMPRPMQSSGLGSGIYHRRDRNFEDPHIESNLQVLKTIQGHHGRWTITDANLSPDNERLIYSSLHPTVYMTSIREQSTYQTPIPFADPPSATRARRNWLDDYSGDNFAIYSTRFSADGSEVIAGGSSMIFVYDLLAGRRTVKIHAHADDVNSCCWADTASGNVLVSASDDSYVKVWDRRSLGTSKKPSGVLVGHTEGITYVSAKGDGRYVISNGKDQSLRLWDLRKMRTSAEFDEMGSRNNYGIRGFDYRYAHPYKPRHAAHPKDCSVMTYRGHSVMRTLIRCHFSPEETTGSQYIYSGSADGRIHIWSLDGRIVEKLDRNQTMPMLFDPSQPEVPQTRRRGGVCVRDVSWHSQEPLLMSAGWDDGMGGSVLACHQWKGLSKFRGRLEDHVEKRTQETTESRLRRSTRLAQLGRRLPGSYEDETDEDEDDEDQAL